MGEADLQTIGRELVAALIEDATRIVGPRGIPLHLVVLRLEQDRPQDDAARAYLDGPAMLRR